MRAKVPMSEPTTQAGRALAARICNAELPCEGHREVVAEVEAEARAAALAETPEAATR